MPGMSTAEIVILYLAIVIVAVMLVVFTRMFKVQGQGLRMKSDREIRHETFEGREQQSVLTTNFLQVQGTVPSDWVIHSFRYDQASWQQYDAIWQDSNILGKVLPDARSLYIVADPYDADRSMKALPVGADMPMGYYVAIYPSEDLADAEKCSFNLQGKVVGYLDRPEYLFLRSVMEGYRIPSSAVNLVQIPRGTWPQLHAVLQDVDMIVTYLVPGSKLHQLLASQDVVVRGFSSINVHRVKLTLPWVQKDESTDIKTVFDSDAKNIRWRVISGATVSSRMKLLTIRQPAEGFIGAEGFITRLELPMDYLDPSYQCFGDKTIEQKALCNSPYDAYGQPKPFHTAWDKPCTKNEDCPFYKANKNYPNNRGGCLPTGTCELPIGVRATSFRSYSIDDGYAPFCYGCKKSNSDVCCENQKSRSNGEGGGLRSPDYAFPDDQTQRKANGMETSISRL